ncbi:MAG: hypothetical protein Aurels2KO_07870 [Aureliella sp.]
MLVFVALERIAAKRHQETVRTEVLRAVSAVRSGTESAINKRVFLTLALKYHVSVNPGITEEEFRCFAESLTSESRGIRSLTLLRDNVITDVYPREGNESAIGLKPLEIPSQRAAALHVIESGGQVLTGPVELKQGGRAFVNRAPVHVATDNDDRYLAGDYWGMVSVLIDYEELIGEIRKTISSDLQIAIQTQGDDSSYLVGSSDILDSEPLVAEITIANDTWRLFGAPRDGWPTGATGAEGRQTLALVLSGVAAFLVLMLVRVTSRYLRTGLQLNEASTNAERARLVLEKTGRMARVGGWEYDLTTQNITWSDEVCRIHERPLGYAPEIEEAIQYYTPAAQVIVREAVERAIKLGEPWDLELELKTAAGRDIWVRTIGEPSYAKGKVVRLWGAFQDITQRRESQQQMLLTQRAVDNAVDAIFFLDSFGKIQYANIAGLRHLGNPDDVSRLSVCDFDKSLSPERWQEKLRVLQREGKCDYSTQLRSAADALIDCDARLWFLTSDGGQQIVAAFRDTTSAKREAELRNVLFEQSSDAHLLFDESGIIECNQAAVEMLRFKDKQSLLASHPAEFSPKVQPDGRESLEKCIEMDALAYENGTHRFDWMHKRQNGEEFLCEVTLTPVQLATGSALLVVWHDISERKRVIDKLAASNLELQQFAYVASHDLQAPLRGIGNFAQFLREDYGDKLDDEAGEYISRIVNGCKRMQQLISDLLTYSRVDARARPFESVDLNTVVDQAIEILEPSITDAGGRITRDDLPTVSGDPSQLLQLMQNLIGNGLKYHRDGVPTVHVSSESLGLCHEVRVRDNGIGIDPDAQDRVFEIFKRLHTQDEYPGTGIGLAICRRIVEQHSGEIGVESSPGDGSTFSFTLPSRGQRLADLGRSASDNSSLASLAEVRSDQQAVAIQSSELQD